MLRRGTFEAGPGVPVRCKGVFSSPRRGVWAVTIFRRFRGVQMLNACFWLVYDTNAFEYVELTNSYISSCTLTPSYIANINLYHELLGPTAISDDLRSTDKFVPPLTTARFQHDPKPHSTLPVSCPRSKTVCYDFSMPNAPNPTLSLIDTPTLSHVAINLLNLQF